MPEAKKLKEAEITVQSHKFDDAKDSGSLKSSEGKYYGVFGSAGKHLLSQFVKGEVCKIEYTETPRKGGDGVWLNLKRKISTTPTVLQRPPIQYPRPRTAPSDSEQIFTVALLKEVYNKDMTALELVDEIKKLRQVYRNTFGATEANRDDEMRDEIPY